MVLFYHKKYHSPSFIKDLPFSISCLNYFTIDSELNIIPNSLDKEKTENETTAIRQKSIQAGFPIGKMV